jgi:hypothetical protein
MTFTNNEKELLKILIKKEKKEFQNDEKKIRPDFPGILKVEENYETFLENLLKKLE